MDMDRTYITLAGECIGDLVTSGALLPTPGQMVPIRVLRRPRNRLCMLSTSQSPVDHPCCIARKVYKKRTPGLFKVEWCGDGFIGLCSKMYYCFRATDKYSTKGVSRCHNEIDKGAFLKVLTKRRSGSRTNCGFRVNNLC